jgi:ABC-2 type transport system permease protein
MRPFRQFADLVRLNLLMNRNEIWFIGMIQVVLTVSFVLGFGYFMRPISEVQALYLTTGIATNTVVMVALVGLPNVLSHGKAEGRLDYYLTLPVSREIYLAAQVAYVALTALPGVAFAVWFGAWHYDLPLVYDPIVIVVVVVGILSLAGVGIAIGVLSPQPQLTNALTNLTVFYVLLFAPVLLPKEQLPALLRHFSVAMPPTYVADAMRGALTELPGTHLARSLWVMAGFTAGSIALSAATIRRRG